MGIVDFLKPKEMNDNFCLIMKEVFFYILKKWWISPITAVVALVILKIIEYFVGHSIFLLSNLPDNRPFLIIEMCILIICLITFLTSSTYYLIKKRCKHLIESVEEFYNG